MTIDGKGVTENCIKGFRECKEKFGKFKVARMDYYKGKSHLKLTDESGKTLLIIDGCEAGYSGEGPSGTKTILEEAGFNIDDTYISSNKEFVINN